ncbi:MAG: response regulator [Ktedonobacteraceae bacterium]|nr:response regulator [Ktedonobacteraceae bacterium]
MIALIEDTPTVAQLITFILEKQGYHIQHFLDGAAFFGTIQDTAYNLVLVDLNLPGNVTGLQVIMSLREMMPHVPIIIVSGASKSLLASVHTLYPTLVIIRKPFKTRELIQEVVAALR